MAVAINANDDSIRCLYAQESASRDQDQPNVVLIIADDLGYGETGMMGNAEIPTPHNRFASCRRRTMHGRLCDRVVLQPVASWNHDRTLSVTFRV